MVRSFDAVARYRYWHGKLLRLYPKPHRERFGESMEQTFNDLCRERQSKGYRLFSFVVWVFAETSTGIIKENLIMHNKTTIGLLLTPLVIMLIPLAAMQFTDAVNWDMTDFIVIGILLYSAVFAYLLLAKMVSNTTHRTVIGAAIVTVVLWLWAELAVGVFTNWGS